MLGLDSKSIDEMLPVGMLTEGISRAFKVNEVEIVQRTPIRSFHHQLEFVRVRLNDDGNGRNADLFVRVYRGQLCWYDVAKCNQPDREWAGWRIAEQATLPLPETLWQGFIDGTAFAIQRKQSGSTVWQVRTPELMSQCGKLLAELHQTRVTDRDRVDLVDTSLDGVVERFGNMAEDVQDVLSIRALQVLNDEAESIRDRPHGFTHGDWHPGNVITDGSRLTAIIDWEDAGYGDPRFDLATMDDFLRRDISLGNQWRRRQLNHLADVFRDAYSEAAGWDVGSMQFWSRLIDVGWMVVGRWLRQRVDQQLSYPWTKPELWFRFGDRSRRRVRRWVKSN